MKLCRAVKHSATPTCPSPLSKMKKTQRDSTIPIAWIVHNIQNKPISKLRGGKSGKKRGKSPIFVPMMTKLNNTSIVHLMTKKF